MKNKSYKLLAMLLLLALPAVIAKGGPEDKENKSWNSIGSNWYIEVGGGAQIMFSQDASILKFKKRITPSISITGGKWFSPYWGVRVQVQGYSFNEFNTTNGIYVGNPLNNGLIYGPNDPVRDNVPIRPDGSYRSYLRYMNIHSDFQVSLANLIGGYKEDRTWDIIPAVGFGYLHSFPYKGTSKVNAISTNFSMMGKYKFPKGFDVNLEAQTVLMPDRFNGRIVGKAYENNFALTVGVTYHFKKKGFKQPRIKANEKELKETLRDIIREELVTQGPVSRGNGTKDTIVIAKEIQKEPVKVAGKPFTLASFLFNNGKAEPLDGQEIQFINIAEYMKKYPNAKIRLEGYADKQTGSDQVNLHLSMRRAMNIRNLLINTYNIDEKQIETQGIGTNRQPYEQNDWNRVVIVTVVEE